MLQTVVATNVTAMAAGSISPDELTAWSSTSILSAILATIGLPSIIP